MSYFAVDPSAVSAGGPILVSAVADLIPTGVAAESAARQADGAAGDAGLAGSLGRFAAALHAAFLGAATAGDVLGRQVSAAAADYQQTDASAMACPAPPGAG